MVTSSTISTISVTLWGEGDQSIEKQANVLALLGALLSLHINNKKEIYTPDAKSKNPSRKNLLCKLFRQAKSINFSTLFGSLAYCT